MERQNNAREGVFEETKIVSTFYIRRVRMHVQVSRQKALITVFVVANAIKQGVIQVRLALRVV